MITKESVYQVVDNYLNDTDYYPVDVKTTPDNRIFVEIDSFNGVSIDFCAELNKHIESTLTPEIDEYELEVSSAGITEPFKVLKQYQKNLDNEVEVLTKDGKKISGILCEANPESFSISIEKMIKPEGAKRKIAVEEKLTFTYEEIKHTKYIFRFK